MKRYENPLVFPFESNQRHNYISAGLTLGICTFLVGSSLDSFFSDIWWESVALWLLVLILLAIGFLMPLAKVNLTGDPIFVTSLGIKLRRIPKQQVFLLCTGIRHTRYFHDTYIGICFGNPQDKEFLSESVIYRHLQKRYFFYFSRHILWVQHTPQREQLLKGMFPNIPWTKLDFNGSRR